MMRCFEDIQLRLEDHWRRYSPWVPFDDLGSHYASAGAIVLAMAMTKTRSILLVSMLTRLPQEFVAFIITKWHRHDEELALHMRDTEACADAQAVDHIDLHDSLDYTIERFWMLADPDENNSLNDLRRGILVGGAYQDWIDADELDDFMNDLCTSSR
jgi:hypothetical protein